MRLKKQQQQQKKKNQKNPNLIEETEVTFYYAVKKRSLYLIEDANLNSFKLQHTVILRG